MFQWHHGAQQQTGFSLKYFGNFFGGQIGVVNPIFFIALIIILFKQRHVIKANPQLYYLLWPFAFTFLFFFYQACFNKSEPNWTAPAFVSGAIILAYFIYHLHYRKTYIAGVILSIAAIIFIKLPWTAPFIPRQSVLLNQFLGYNVLMQQASHYYKPGDILYADSYQMASEAAFYLPDQPQTYIFLPDQARLHEYQFWLSIAQGLVLPGTEFWQWPVPSQQPSIMQWLSQVITALKNQYNAIFRSRVLNNDPSQYLFWPHPITEAQIKVWWSKIYILQNYYLCWVVPEDPQLAYNFWGNMLSFQSAYVSWSQPYGRQSQYTYWSNAVNSAVKQQQIPALWYIGSVDNLLDLKHYFKNCEKTANLEYNGHFLNRTIVLYYCSNQPD